MSHGADITEGTVRTSDSIAGNPPEPCRSVGRRSIVGIGASMLLSLFTVPSLATQATPSSGESDDATAERNAAIGRRILVEVWGEGKLEVVDELLAPNYVDHTPRGPEPSSVQGAAGLKQAVTLFRNAFPDLTYRVDLQIVQGELVATRFTATGTHTGTFQDIPPTGRRVTYTGIDMNRIIDGRIVEAWVNYDALGLLQQIGAVPNGVSDATGTPSS